MPDWLSIPGVDPRLIPWAEWGIRVIMAGVVVARRRSVPTTLAWLVLVLAVPILGTLVYLLVGENRLGRRRLREYEQLTTQVEPLIVSRWWEQGLAVGEVDSPDARAMFQLATSLGGLPPLRDNSLELVSDADEMLSLLARDIDGASSHCHLLYYIWMVGGRTEEVCRALERAAARGVECRVLVDDVGSAEFLRSASCRSLRRAGVDVRSSLEVGTLRAMVARLDLRNHRKIAVIDGKIGYVGSQNLTDSTFTFRQAKKTGLWIDSTARVRGAAVQALAMVFLRDWAMEVDDPLALEARYFPAPDPPAGEPLSVAQVVPTGPGREPAGLREIVLAGIYGARQELWVATPYFVPDEATQVAFLGAARRGVRVTLIVPRRGDHALVAAASRSHFAELLGSGVRVVRHSGGLLHSKMICIDERFAVIGSANIDIRSFELNFEASMLVYGQGFARRVRTLMRRYEEQGEVLDAAGWARRPAWTRASESVARLFGPLL